MFECDFVFAQLRWRDYVFRVLLCVRNGWFVHVIS